MKEIIKEFLNFDIKDLNSFGPFLNKIVLDITGAKEEEINNLNEKEQKLLLAIYGLWEYMSDYMFAANDLNKLQKMPPFIIDKYFEAIIDFNSTDKENDLFKEILFDYGIYHWENESDKKIDFKFNLER